MFRTLYYPPTQGQHYLAVNVNGLAKPEVILAALRAIGLAPELVLLVDLEKITAHCHVLAFEEQTPGELLDVPEVDALIERLTDHVERDRILHAYGGQLKSHT